MGDGIFQAERQHMDPKRIHIVTIPSIASKEKAWEGRESLDRLRTA
jgi:hypothetical protein